MSLECERMGISCEVISARLLQYNGALGKPNKTHEQFCRDDTFLVVSSFQDDSFLPDWLTNPGEYEPPFHILQGHATAYPTGFITSHVNQQYCLVYKSIFVLIILLYKSS